jgi:dolichyl-phosphate beta-glucosyltransferase
MYNEGAVIEQTAQRLSVAMQAAFDDYEILFSDDGSTDGCGNLVRALALPNVRVTGYEKNRGKGCAVRTGILAATGDIVIFTDADLAYGTDVIAEAVRRMDAAPEYGMLIGSRNLDRRGYGDYTLLRRIASKIYIRVLCLVGGFRLSDSQCGFKAFRRDAAERIFSRAKVDGFAFDFEAILRAKKEGIAILEMAVCVQNHGSSKVRVLRDSFKMLSDLRRIRKDVKNEK